MRKLKVYLDTASILQPQYLRDVILLHHGILSIL